MWSGEEGDGVSDIHAGLCAFMCVCVCVYVLTHACMHVYVCLCSISKSWLLLLM